MPATRRPRRILSASAALVTVLGVGLILTLTAHRGTRTSASGSSPVSGRRSPTPVSTSPSSTPELPQVDLAGLRWNDFHGVQLPSSPEAGPHDTSGGLATGYADTPLGALLAALNIAVRANAQWGPAIFGPTIRDQVTGPDASALLANCQSVYDQASQAAHIPSGQSLGNAYVTEQAFRWVAYTSSDAVVDLVSAGPGSQGVTVRAVTRVQVVWQTGDWRVVAPPGGDWGNSATQLPSLNGFTVFPGQG